MTEVRSPLLVEDFEEGDRIYVHDGMRHYDFGTVVSIIDGLMEVKLESGYKFTLHSPLPPRWGKPLQMELLVPGLTISAIGFSKKRVRAIVVSYTPGKELVLKSTHDDTNLRAYVPGAMSLENQFKYWEIEG